MSIPKINLDIELSEDNIKDLYKEKKIGLYLEIKLRKNEVVMTKKDVLKAIAMK